MVVNSGVPLTTVAVSPSTKPVIVAVKAGFSWPKPRLAASAVTVKGALAIVIARVWFAVPVLVVAPIVTLKLPACVGVPLITPVPAATESPGGSPVALKLVGEPAAAIVYVNGEPWVPVAEAALVITSLELSVTLCVADAAPSPAEVTARTCTL